MARRRGKGREYGLLPDGTVKTVGRGDKKPLIMIDSRAMNIEQAREILTNRNLLNNLNTLENANLLNNFVVIRQEKLQAYLQQPTVQITPTPTPTVIPEFTVQDDVVSEGFDVTTVKLDLVSASVSFEVLNYNYEQFSGLLEDTHRRMIHFKGYPIVLDMNEYQAQQSIMDIAKTYYGERYNQFYPDHEIIFMDRFYIEYEINGKKFKKKG